MEGTLGEIRLFAGNFAPRGWAFCEGQLLPIAQNQALFSILGTTYGGDGRTTFALPDLRGRAPISPRQGPGLSDYRLGQQGGTETVTLTTAQIPSHNHSEQSQLTVAAPAGGPASSTSPNPSSCFGATSTPSYSNAPATTTLEGGPVSGSVTVGNNGGGLSHENRQPYTAIHFIIALYGIFPSRG